MIIELIPSHWRKPMYLSYALVGVALGAVQVGVGAAEAGQPLWLTVSLAVYAFLGGAFGFVAGANVNPSQLVLTPDEKLLISDSRALNGSDYTP